MRLVYYFGSRTDSNGKVTHQRKIETLDLFLYAKPTTSIEREHNREVNKQAESIEAKRTVEHFSGKHGFKTTVKSKADFIIYLDIILEEKRKTTREAAVKVAECSFNQFKKYARLYCHSSNYQKISLTGLQIT